VVIYVSITLKYIQLCSINFKVCSRRVATYALHIRSKCIYRDIITLVVAVFSDIIYRCCWGWGELKERQKFIIKCNLAPSQGEGILFMKKGNIIGIVNQQQYISSRISANKNNLIMIKFVILRSAPRLNLIEEVTDGNGWSPQGLGGEGPKPCQHRTRICKLLVHAENMLIFCKCLELTRVVIICKVVCGVVVLEF
jgi:hypothetical protein